jgi:phenylacetate-coenzyme A ligase PaaK-like adenylate-forming protein
MKSASEEAVQRLNETLARAASLSPYYRDAFRGLDLTMRSPEDLRRLPVLTRQTLVTRAFDMLIEGCVPVTVSMTGGTTSAADGKSRSVITFHDEQEARARRAMLDEHYGKLNPRPLFLNLVNLGHGYDTSVPLEGAFQMALERPFQLEAILELLRHEFAFPGFTRRIRAIVGAVRLLKALTLLCVQREIDTAEFRIDLISTSSQHLTSRWRGLLTDYWGAKVDETYGLSEVPGLHGRRCVACGRFHFAPQAVVEILALDGDEPADKGVGRVVGTCLHPLASMQPIIRYDTGDVIEITGECATAGTFGFEFLGRIRDLVILPDVGRPRVVLSPVSVNEILDATPGIACEQFGFARGLDLRHGTGFQRWGLRHDEQKRELTLDIELAWSPWEYRRAAAELAGGIREQVLADAAGLQEAVTAGEISFVVELHEPGTTDLKGLV